MFRKKRSECLEPQHLRSHASRDRRQPWGADRAGGGGGPTPASLPGPTGWRGRMRQAASRPAGRGTRGAGPCAEASLGLQRGWEPRRELRSESAEGRRVQTRSAAPWGSGGPRGLSLRAEFCVKLCTLPANGQSERVDGGAAHAYGGSKTPGSGRRAGGPGLARQLQARPTGVSAARCRGSRFYNKVLERQAAVSRGPLGKGLCGAHGPGQGHSEEEGPVVPGTGTGRHCGWTGTVRGAAGRVPHRPRSAPQGLRPWCLHLPCCKLGLFMRVHVSHLGVLGDTLGTLR